MVNRKKWEYHVINVNVDKNSSNPQTASEKFKGALSSEFIKKEFPKNYNNNKKSIHPAGQLAKFLNKLGQDGWELSETFELDKMLMIVFRREFLEDNNKENKINI